VSQVLPSAAATEVDLLAAAVLACPAVVSLHPGGPDYVATYLPGRRVDGVRVDDAVVEVAVVAATGVPVHVVAAQVRSAVAELAAGRAVDVHIGDVAPPGEGGSAPLPSGPA
jgi:hypothetical protein